MSRERVIGISCKFPRLPSQDSREKRAKVDLEKMLALSGRG